MEYRMIRRYEFIIRTLCLIGKILENSLPAEGTLDEMVRKRNLLIQKFIK
jgi:hypothetical protein